MNQGSWTNAEKRFVRDNAGKLTVEEMACRIGRTSSAVKMFLIRNRIAVGTQIKRNILQEILKIKFVHPEYFKPTRAFYQQSVCHKYTFGIYIMAVYKLQSRNM